MEKKSRSANFELLRIACMLLIVMSHAISCGGIATSVTSGTVNYILIWIIRALCRVSVPCFVMINGYFMCKKELHLRRMLGVWVTTFFYSVGIYLALCLLGLEEFTKYNTIIAMVPVMTQRYWFVTSYMLLLLWTPVLNRAISLMNQKQHLLLLLAMGLVYGPMANGMQWAFDFTRAASGYSYSYFLFLYLVAAYLRLYPGKRNHQYGMGYLAISLLIAGVTILLEQLDGIIPNTLYKPYVFYNINSILVLCATLCFFNFFRHLELQQERFSTWICKISPLTFGVYLIHEHQSLRSLLWNNLLHMSQNAMSYQVFPYLAICTLCVFIVCIGIEWIRGQVFASLGIDTKVIVFADRIENRLSRLIDLHINSDKN